jgi:hypothetical protein
MKAGRQWPPRPLVVFSIGVCLGLAVLGPKFISDFGEEVTSPVNPFVLVMLLGVSLALLVTPETFRATATAGMMTIAFWLLLYSGLSLHRWRGRVKMTDQIRETQLGAERFSARSRQGVLNRVAPDQRPSVRQELKDLDTDLRNHNAAAVAELEDEAIEFRRSSFFALCASLLCVAGVGLAMLRTRTR